MPLKLTITSYHKLTPGQCVEKVVGNGSISLGRGVENDWVLPDPERLVSGRHCTIAFQGGAYYVTDTSTNGTFLVEGNRRLSRGNSERLNPGDVLRLGEYEIRVELDADSPAMASPAPLGNPFAPETPLGFDQLLSAHAGADTSSGSSWSASPAPGSPSLPMSEDPFGGFGASNHPIPASSPGAGLGGPIPVKSDLFDFLEPPVPPAPVPDHAPAQQFEFTPPPAPVMPASSAPPAANAFMIPDDWDPFADPGAARAPAAPAATPAPVPLAPSVPEVSTPVTAPVPAPTPAQATTSPRSETRTGDAAALFQAFLRGAGMEQLRFDNNRPEVLMEGLGRGYRHMVEGLIDILRARASLKGEFRMSQTMIRPVENNPLKFAPNVEEAMLLLLRGGSGAFMAPDQAIRESFDDLKAHQLAVMAGVQAALSHLLRRFDPAVLEQRIGQQSVLSNLVPGGRRAKYWDVFTELYASIQREAEDDFQELFGREFSRAYEEQTARMRNK